MDAKSLAPHLQALAELGILFRGLVHDVAGPLNTNIQATRDLETYLRGLDEFLQGLFDDSPDSQEVSDHVRGLMLVMYERLSFLHTSHTHMSQLIDATRHYASHHNEQAEEFDLVLQLRRALTLAHAKLALIDWKAEHPESLRMFGQPAEIMRVMLNLFNNAYEAAHDPKKIRIRLVPEAHDGRPGVRFEVEDNGGGIPPELEEKIFELFFTTKAHRGGTGLGLAIADRIVRYHQGRWLMGRSEELGGARIGFWIPLNEVEAHD